MSTLLCFLLFIIIVCLVVLYVSMHFTLFKGGLMKFLGGAQSKSEQKVIASLEEITGLTFKTAHPPWLKFQGKRLELDGYNAQAKLAIEFSGPLHTKWSPGYESYTKYFNRLMNDKAKRIICKKHNVDLIVVDMSLPPRHYRDYLLSRLYDLGRVGARPDNYIAPQKAKPFRNKKLEAELKLISKLPGNKNAAQ